MIKSKKRCYRLIIAFLIVLLVIPSLFINVSASDGNNLLTGYYTYRKYLFDGVKSVSEDYVYELVWILDDVYMAQDSNITPIHYVDGVLPSGNGNTNISGYIVGGFDYLWTDNHEYHIESFTDMYFIYIMDDSFELRAKFYLDNGNIIDIVLAQFLYESHHEVYEWSSNQYALFNQFISDDVNPVFYFYTTFIASDNHTYNCWIDFLFPYLYSESDAFNTFLNLVDSLVRIPVNMVQQILSFNILGIAVFSAVATILAVLIVIYIVKRFKN